MTQHGRPMTAISEGGAILQGKQGGTFTAAYTTPTTAAGVGGNALLRRNREYPLYEGNGSERTVTDGYQSVMVRTNYEAFGQTFVGARFIAHHVALSVGPRSACTNARRCHAGACAVRPPANYR